MNTYEKARAFMYRCARPLELALWQYHFEGGSAENVLHALSFYQNEDGGFGHALEADNWNPHSSPLTTQTATEILYAVNAPADHPIVQNTLRYLDSGADFDTMHRQWPGSVPTNNEHPHAIWWTYEADKEAYQYNPTVGLAAFMLHYADRDSAVYRKGLALAREAVEWLLQQEPFAEKHVVFLFQRLAQYGKGHGIPRFDEMVERLDTLAPLCVCTDLSKYGVEYVEDLKTRERRPTLHFLRRRHCSLPGWGSFLTALPRKIWQLQAWLSPRQLWPYWPGFRQVSMNRFSGSLSESWLWEGQAVQSLQRPMPEV